MKLQSFFFDQTGRPPEAGKLRRPAAALNSDTRHLKPTNLREAQISLDYCASVRAEF